MYLKQWPVQYNNPSLVHSMTSTLNGLSVHRAITETLYNAGHEASALVRVWEGIGTSPIFPSHTVKRFLTRMAADFCSLFTVTEVISQARRLFGDAVSPPPHCFLYCSHDSLTQTKLEQEYERDPWHSLHGAALNMHTLRACHRTDQLWFGAQLILRHLWTAQFVSYYHIRKCLLRGMNSRTWSRF